MQLNTQALKALRQSGGDSHRTLATRAGLSARSLSLLERGDTQPRVSTIKKLADALGVPVGAITHVPTDRTDS